ncbi:hypothetical protein CERSUDRAFT_99207 [Gelatoporia subvermispora B]|uniref:Uncharacterized protein n=1 Tax=Ceriporiopsis subvermispora (strain B) TaxID=914234 RepID=M2Q7M9_CERS8|nr:hypothetical protein CERSUDRAFT_99207 [Gelatoporia subvermispora B]
MPFAQGLNLEKMDVGPFLTPGRGWLIAFEQIYMNAKCPISPLYIHLLLSPRLAETLNELVITVRDKCILDSVAFSTFNLRHRERHVELMSLQKLSVDIAMQETGTDQDHVLLDFLRILVATNLKSLRVFLSYGYCASVQFAHVGEEGNASCYLQELDDFFDSPQFPCLEKVSITLQSMCAEDFECVLAMPSHQLPFPALRRWELLILQVSERQNPLRFLQVIPPQGHK